MGKCGSLYLAVPGAYVILRRFYAAMGSHSRKESPTLSISAGIRAELEKWLDVRAWCGGSATWASPHHFTVIVEGPLSPRLLMARFSSPSSSGGAPVVLGGSGAPASAQGSVDALGDEALEACTDLGHPSACFLGLLAGLGWRPSTLFARNWSMSIGGGARAKRLLRLMATWSAVHLNAIRLPDSTQHAWFAADRGSFVLCPSMWEVVERVFGPHDIGLISSDSNSHLSPLGRPLPHFTHWPFADYTGVKVFSQAMFGLNAYCDAVFSLMSSLLISHFRHQRASVS